jgi:S-DNA-T family DNA segregation ATPase FtsK/SpoIIIE
VRLTVTVVDPTTDQQADVFLDSDGQTTIAAIARALFATLGRDTDALFVGGAGLDPASSLHDSALREGSIVSLGSASACDARDATSPDGVTLEPSVDGTGLDFNRPPRLLPPLRQTRFRFPSKPREQERRPLPIVMAIVPLAMAAVMVLVFRRWYFVIFGLLSPLSLLGSHVYDRRTGRKSHRRLLAEYRETRAAIEADATRALQAEQLARHTHFPEPADILRIASGPRPRLWERRQHDADALTIRVGIADVDSEVVLDDPDQLEHKREQRWTAVEVPVTVALRERGVLGVAGRADFARALARWTVVQSAVLHSPTDLRIYVLTDGSASMSWQWLRWLPHARPVEGQDTVTLIGTDADSTASRVAELVAIITDRQHRMSPGVVLDEPDVLVVLDGARRLRSFPGVIQLLREGPTVGVFSVCIDADERLLPEECEAVVAEQAIGARLLQMRTDAVESVAADVVTPEWCAQVARALSPLRDVR